MRRNAKPPKDLSKDAKALWRRIFDASEMDEAATLLLDTLAQQYDRMLQARALIDRDGLTLTETTAAGHAKVRQHPACQVERDAVAAMCRCWRLLGYDQAPPEGI